MRFVESRDRRLFVGLGNHIKFKLSELGDECGGSLFCGGPNDWVNCSYVSSFCRVGKFSSRRGVRNHCVAGVLRGGQVRLCTGSGGLVVFRRRGQLILVGRHMV